MDLTVWKASMEDIDAILLSEDLFDDPPRREWTEEVLSDPRHHLVLAAMGMRLVGFLSAVHYLHPDKAPQMWINELGVVEDQRRKGVARRLVDLAAGTAQGLGCSAIWVLSDPTVEALGFYTALGWHREGDHVAMFTRDLP